MSAGTRQRRQRGGGEEDPTYERRWAAQGQGGGGGDCRRGCADARRGDGRATRPTGAATRQRPQRACRSKRHRRAGGGGRDRRRARTADDIRAGGRRTRPAESAHGRTSRGEERAAETPGGRGWRQAGAGSPPAHARVPALFLGHPWLATAGLAGTPFQSATNGRMHNGFAVSAARPRTARHGGPPLRRSSISVSSCFSAPSARPPSPTTGRRGSALCTRYTPPPSYAVRLPLPGAPSVPAARGIRTGGRRHDLAATPTPSASTVLACPLPSPSS